MEIVNDILDIFKYILPSVVVLLTSYYIVKKFLETQTRKTALELRRQTQQQITPVRLQAYERIILLLERISPSSVVMRVGKNAASAREMHQELLTSIRSEFDHNLTQQIYVSEGAWEAVKKAKEETVKMINIAAARVPEDAKGIDLSKALLEMTVQMEKLPTQMAIDAIKSEVRAIF